MSNDKSSPTSTPKKKKPKTAKPLDADKSGYDDKLSNFFGRVSDVTSSAFKIAKRTGDTSYKVGKALIQSQDQLKLMVSAGQSLKDMREVAGLTISELSEALSLKDKTILEAVENGTATLSFELILRLSALLARNDPIPFILKYSRTYSPDTWKLLHDWGAGRLPLQYQREREFINIYRSKDEARQLSDEGFSKVLEFTRQAFNMSLHFASEQEENLRNGLNTQQNAEEEKPNVTQKNEETSTNDTKPTPQNNND
jgi:transcriptional regulator with XRE-family HTH domain